VDPSDRPLSHEERNRLILRRTLSAISGIWSLWSLALGASFWHLGKSYGLWMMGHAAVLALAGFGLWKPRRWGWAAAFLAAAGGAGFAAFDAPRSFQSAALDAVYPLLCLVLFPLARPRKI
jgi:hypothetical protein